MITRAQSINIHVVVAVTADENLKIERSYRQHLTVKFQNLPGMFVLTLYRLTDIEITDDGPLYILDVEMESVQDANSSSALVEFTN